MAVLKQPKKLSSVVLEFIKSWLQVLFFRNDKHTDDLLEELHISLAPWLLPTTAESLIRSAMEDAAVGSDAKVAIFRIAFSRSQTRVAFTFMGDAYYMGILRVLKRRGENLGTET